VNVAQLILLLSKCRQTAFVKIQIATAEGVTATAEPTKLEETSRRIAHETYVDILTICGVE